MIGSVAFRNFKALRSASVPLAPCNIVVGPNGSGKTSLIQALLRLRTLARLPLKTAPVAERNPEGPVITIVPDPPFADLRLVMSCVSDLQCDLLEVQPAESTATGPGWTELRERLLGIRAYLLDHYAMALPTPAHDSAALSSNGGNLSAVLARWKTEQTGAFESVRLDVLRMLPEHDELDLVSRTGGTVELALRIRDGGEWVFSDNLSQGTLYLVALAVLAHDPLPPSLLCIEEIDRGIHPRLLREVRDLLYRLSYPGSVGLARPAAQVITTTHSPYLLDLFRDHPEEVIIAERSGPAASFSRLVDRADLTTLLADGSLGDLWFSGILGGVPDGA